MSTLEHASDNTRPSTNIIPKGMPYDDMVDSYIALYCRLLADREIALRIRNKLRHLGNAVYREARVAGVQGVRSRVHTRRKRRWASCGDWSTGASSLEVRFACGISCIQCPG